MSGEAATVKLRDVASFIRGVTFKPDDVVPAEDPDTVACMRTKNVQSDLDLSDVWSINRHLVKRPEQYLRAGDTLVSSANSWNLVGKCCWVPELARPSTFGGFVSVLRARSEQIDQRYLYHWFASPRVQTTARSFSRQTTNIANLDLARCLDLDLPLPDPAEQRRIATVLDRADALRRDRRDATTLAGELPTAVFHELFGNPLSPPPEWPVVKLGSLARVIRGASPRPAGDPRYFGGSIPWLKISDVSAARGRFIRTIKETVTEAGRDKSVYLEPGTLILTNSATVGIPKFLAVGSCIHDGFVAFLDIDDRLLPDYLHAFLAVIRPHLLRLAPEGTQKNLNTPIIKNIDVAVPPLELQQELTRRTAAVESIQGSVERSAEEVDALFATLRHRAFRGEL